MGFKGNSWFQVGFHCSRSVFIVPDGFFMVFQVTGWIFMVPGGFLSSFMVPGWYKSELSARGAK